MTLRLVFNRDDLARGLISSDRRGGAVLHSLTRLGTALLTADQTGTDP